MLGESVGDMASFGWSVSKDGPHSWETLRENVQNHIRSLNFGYRVALRDKNVTYLNKLGKFKGPHELEVRNKRFLCFGLVDTHRRCFSLTDGR